MGQDALCFLSISELGEKLRSKAVSPVEVTRTVLDRIDRHNDQMRVYITVTRDVALRQAQEAEKEILGGTYRGPLHGVPISLKDNVLTEGIRTTCASALFLDWIPDVDATVYTKLRDTGAVLVGKANMSELAFSGNPTFPPPLNPWRYDRTPSGSSSGSAVGLATGMAYGSIGTDTGGSGRGPASSNGVVGFKPTYGRVSRCGVFPTSYSLDNLSMMARTVADSAILLQATAGPDPRDESSSTQPVLDFMGRVGSGLKGMRIGLAQGYRYEHVDEDVVGVIAAAVQVLRGLGAEVSSVPLPCVQQCGATYTAIANAEAATVHYENLRVRPEKIGPIIRSRLDLGNALPATAYIQAQQMRKLMRDGYRELFRSFDVIVGPASPTRVGKANEEFTATTTVNGREVRNRELGEGYLNCYALTGLPALVLPAGFSSEGTPIGLQVAGKWFDEQTVLQVAHAFERATEWHLRRPLNPSE